MRIVLKAQKKRKNKMKKLMFTAVALVAGFAMADIASSTVGYTQADFVQKFNAVTPVFVDVGNDAGYNICAVDGTFTVGDNIQIFDEDGNVEATLTWKTLKGNTGWHNDKVYLTEYILPRGKSAWFYTENPMSVTQSGAVYDKPYTITFGAKFNQTGNPTPVALTLSQFNFTGITIGDNIQIFDKDGNATTTYTWKTLKGNTGWHNDKVYVPDQEIPAGQAFWVYCSAAGATMTIPAVL
jgi:hypothetical protein